MAGLNELEYPRHLHQTEGRHRRVDSPAEAKAAIAEGWSLTVPVEAPADPPAEPVAPVEPVNQPKPTKDRKPKGH
jgi:hypothetical protein